METAVRVIGLLVLAIAMAIGVGFLMAFPIKWLWNYLAPTMGWPIVTVWQAWALNVLCALLFKTTATTSKD